MTATSPISRVLSIAAAIATSDLNPAYATSDAVQLAAAVVLDDPASLDDVADRLDAYADGIGLHDLGDDPDLVSELHQWSHALREIAGAPLGGAAA